MLVLVSYDVNTQTPGGVKRLRHVARQCEAHGQRVQCSVFECHLDAAQARKLKESLIEIIDKEQDSLRFYYLGNNYRNKVEHVGTKVCIDLDGDLLL